MLNHWPALAPAEETNFMPWGQGAWVERSRIFGLSSATDLFGTAPQWPNAGGVHQGLVRRTSRTSSSMTRQVA